VTAREITRFEPGHAYLAADGEIYWRHFPEECDADMPWRNFDGCDVDALMPKRPLRKLVPEPEAAA